MRLVGIDVGSTMTKTVVLENEEPVYETVPTLKYLEGRASGEYDLKGSIAVATGYGRRWSGAGEEIPEIRAHVLGALAQTNVRDFTLLDIGGQDYKVIKVRGGVISDFVMNDKCAAGTGRFLERMAAQLGMTLEELGACWSRPVEVSSVCTVFAETEVVTRLVEGAHREQIAAGVNWSLYRRVRPVLERFRSELLVLSGGGASFPALGRILESEGYELARLPMPLHNGAIGCLELAKKIATGQRIRN